MQALRRFMQFFAIRHATFGSCLNSKLRGWVQRIPDLAAASPETLTLYFEKENKAMKRILLGTLFTAVSLNAMAQAPGGPDCGWGNMLFEGQRGTPAHFLASTTNVTSGNATFGMTSGTNGCSTNASLTYGGKSWFAMNGMMNELSEDMAKGQGEALTTYAVVLGVAPEDRAHFAAVTHQHFQEIFNSADVTAEDVHGNTLAVLKNDPRLAKYATQA